MNIWRLHLNTDTFDGRTIADLCLENNIMALGWSLRDKDFATWPAGKQEKMREARAKIASCDIFKQYGQYAKFIKRWPIYGSKKVNANVDNLYNGVEPDDLVWIRSKSIYYLGRVGDESVGHYNASEEILALDAANQRTHVKWYAVGDESCVPGKVTTAFIRGRTLQRINAYEVSAFSQHYYHTKIDSNYYKDVVIEANQDSFYGLISPTDCEDLVCAYLFKKFGYIVIPSTNKDSTELYECVLLNPKDRKHIYIQCKKGNVDLYADNYKHLNGEVFLFTSAGSVHKLETVPDNIKRITPEELYEFAMSDEAKNVVSDSISHWTEYLRQAK